MGLVELETPPEGGENWKWVGLEESGRVVARAGLVRQDDGTVEIGALSGTDGSRALVEALADVVNAEALVVGPAREERQFFEGCGFDADEAGRYLRRLEAEPDPAPSVTWTLSELEEAIRASWSAETSDTPDSWTAANPARHQCDVTALLVCELLGGETMSANVVKDGRRLERHAWNRLPSGLEVDLTRCQYRDGEEVAPAAAGELIRLRRCSERYELLARSVRARLGLTG